MRSSLRFGSCAAAVASILLVAAPSFADEPAPGGAAPAPAAAPGEAPALPPTTPPATPPPATEPAPGELPSWAPPPLARSSGPAADAPADAPSEEGDTRRAEGIRLGLELGFQRAFSGNEDRLNAGSPTILPLGASLSFRTSPALLLGFHGYAALASRDDCISADSCRARAYAFGGHIETALSRGKSFVPFLRYAVNYEILYQGGAPLDPAGHTYRGAFDFFDLRVGGDWVVHRGSEGKTARIGVFAGLVGGILMNQTGVSYLNGSSGTQPRNLERTAGSAHLWFAMGVRGTLDP